MLASHEQESFNDIMVRWMKDRGPKVRNMLRRNGLTLDEAEDMMQEAVVKACQQRDEGREPTTNPEGWLTTIAINAATDYFRKRAAEARCRERLVESGKVRDSYDPPADEEREAILGKLLALLDGEGSFDSALTIVEWRFFDGCSFAEIGDVLEVSEMTARRRCDRAVQRLLQALEDQGIKSLPEPW